MRLATVDCCLARVASFSPTACNGRLTLAAASVDCLLRAVMPHLPLAATPVCSVTFPSFLPVATGRYEKSRAAAFRLSSFLRLI